MPLWATAVKELVQDWDEGEIELQSSPVATSAMGRLWSENGLSELSHTGLKGQPPCAHLSRSLNVGRPLGQVCPEAEQTHGAELKAVS